MIDINFRFCRVKCCALAMTLTSLLAIRPDLDDVSYISRTLGFICNPDTPMDFAFPGPTWYDCVG